MQFKERFLTVVVMCAMVSVILGVADSLNLDGGLFDLLVSSFAANLAFFAICWLLAPWLYKKLNL